MGFPNNIGITYALWFLYLLFAPFYFFNSGEPQIADFIIVLIAIIDGKNLISRMFNNDFIKAIGLLVLYIFVINTFWAIVYQDFNIFKNNFFYIFNYIIALFCNAHIRNKSFLKITYWAVICTILIQICLMPFHTERLRLQIYFNNPNQLGYWALLMTFIWYILSHLFKSNNVIKLTFLLLGSLLVLGSISKAAIGSILIVLPYYFIKNFRKNFIFLAFLIITAIGFVRYQNISIQDFNVLNNLIFRLENDSTSDDSLMARGYDRLFNEPYYMIFGSGEGKNDRFDSVWYGEIHSIPATVLFCYGIIGFALTIYLLYLLFKRNKLVFSITLIGILFYSLTHMGLRFTQLWVFLVFLYHVPNIQKVLDRKLPSTFYINS